MANNTEVIFEDIEQRILKEIGESHYAIFVSVAWFTNKKLFNALLEKAKSNCYVSIIIQLDEINSQSGIDYSQIEIGRSECFKISKDAELLHDKFCVIDFKKVITGSYNWTYKAAHNSENILILDDPTVATQYISRFEQQKSKYMEFNVASTRKTIPNTSQKDIEIKKPSNISPKKVAPTKERPRCPGASDHKMECGDMFCCYCGQQAIPRKIKRVITCKKCRRKQEGALIDANRTKFCIFCGSSNLKYEKIVD